MEPCWGLDCSSHPVCSPRKSICCAHDSILLAVAGKMQWVPFLFVNTHAPVFYSACIRLLNLNWMTSAMSPSQLGFEASHPENLEYLLRYLSERGVPCWVELLFWGLQGSQQLYSSLLRPLLLKHQARLDRVVDGTRNEMVSVLWLYLFAKH